jgi:long-subunit acyl-CoA synthetase (AMP-forming)
VASAFPICAVVDRIERIRTVVPIDITAVNRAEKSVNLNRTEFRTVRPAFLKIGIVVVPVYSASTIQLVNKILPDSRSTEGFPVVLTAVDPQRTRLDKYKT